VNGEAIFYTCNCRERNQRLGKCPCRPLLQRCFHTLT
jgi:hypothetical protein